MTRQTLLTATLAGLATAAVLFARQPDAAAPSFDLLIRHARIVDGSGSPWYRGDVAISGDTIVQIAPVIEAPAASSTDGRVIDAKGLILAPGFIDIHTHARRGIFDVPTAENYVRQGVTTVMEGPDGSSPLPLQAFLEKLEALGTSVNIGSFVGQGSIRREVMGEVDREPSAGEIERMRRLVDREMRAGAFGLSTGLFYVPGTFSTTSEVVELAKVAGRYGGLHISHMRDEASRVADSVKETITIGEQGGLPTQVTHHKVVGVANWGQSVETLRLVDEARARGVDVTIDQYPYTASSTSVQAALLPTWAQEGGEERIRARLRDPATRAKIRAETVRIIRDERGGGDPKNVQLARCDWQPSLAGKTLGDVTRERGQEPTLEQSAETALWIIEQGGCQGIFHAIGEEDLVRILQHPATMIASDGEVPIFGENVPHPRSYGTFARVLGVYVREKRVLTLEEAVRKMSALPAQRLSLGDRGLLRPGLRADLVLFDPASVRASATYERPHQYAEGVSLVVVNGEIVFEQGAMTSARPGRVLYGPGRPAEAPTGSSGAR
ncbi:MAG: amidohydrolase family protein [Luteitalea sp.]|nr:amidohydrolase family protein [Luteitalea sp.]